MSLHGTGEQVVCDRCTRLMVVVESYCLIVGISIEIRANYYQRVLRK